MRVLLYNYSIVFRNLFSDEIKNGTFPELETFQTFQSFFNAWKSNENMTVIIPLSAFDTVGFDIRDLFHEYTKENGVSDIKYILIGTTKQIEFALTQNDKFLKHDIQEIKLPILFDTLELAIKSKLEV